MSRAAPTEYEKDFVRLGIELYQANNATRARIHCVGPCRGTVDTAMNVGLPPAGLAANFRRKGWNNRNDAWTCPSCQSPKLRQRLEAERNQDRPSAPPPYITHLPAAAPVVDLLAHVAKTAARQGKPAEPAADEREEREGPIVDARRQTLEVLRTVGMLNKFFSGAHYQSGWSDKRVAEELDLSPERVAQIRETSPDHGPLRGDPEVVAIRDNLLTLRAMVDAEIQRIDAYEDSRRH